MNSQIVNIKKINWIDQDALESEVLFEISGKQFWAFCHPCNFIEGEIAEVYFSFIEEDISESAFWNENRARKKEIISSENNKWAYYCYGHLKSTQPLVIDCGALAFSFENGINDKSTIGNYVYFVISRLDIIKCTVSDI